MQSHEEVKLDTLAEHSADMKIFLASECTIRSPFRSELQIEIEELCSGIFLCVVLVVKLLKRSFDKGATRSQLRETLISLPRELNELFAKIYQISRFGLRYSYALGVVCKGVANSRTIVLHFPNRFGAIERGILGFS